jgi:F420-0:gamma-glutamyl ligase
MIITPIKTHRITLKDKDLFKILDKYILSMPENSVLAITSKIISLTENRIISFDKISKKDLVKQESDLFIPASENKFDVSLSIKNNTLIASGGIDLSNKNKYYILWPKNPQESANEIRKYLKEKFNLKNFGVVITDSVCTPFRWGATGICIAWSGFIPFKNYKNPRIYQRFKKANIADGIASAAVLAMGEGAEKTPMALLEDLPMVEFINHNPTEKEINKYKLKMADDVFAPILEKANWKKGGNGK